MSFIAGKEALNQLIEQADTPLAALEVTVSSRALSSEEAIGHPDRQDFPLIRGKEVLLQADIEGCIGQAFTADPIAFRGTLGDLIKGLTERPGHQALAVAVLNALARKLDLTANTVHCMDNEPEECAQWIATYIYSQHGPCKLGIIGYQPALLEHCQARFGPENVRITDLSPDLVGHVRYGVKVWDGIEDLAKLVDFSEVLLITGTVLANGTFVDIWPVIKSKAYYFYGTTCAGLAAVNQSNRLCPMSK